MKIFTDLHHSGLMYSLKLLFEDRLGHELFRPIGTDWFYEGFWRIAEPYGNDIGTINQYLELKFTPDDGSPRLNQPVKIREDYYEIEENEHDYIQKAITLEQFKEMDIDIIIASIPDHYTAYRELIKEHKPNAKLICQMGNIGWNSELIIKEREVKNLMASTMPFKASTHSVFYHQEMPIIEYKEPTTKNIKSLVHLLPEPQVYEKFKGSLPEYKFTAHGASTPDGWVNKLENVYKEMQGSLWGYHNKPGGDGFGWIIHAWFMVGRPVIVNYDDYRDKLAGQMMQPGINCVDINDPIEDISKLDPIEMGKRARKAFMEAVDYPEEQKKIKYFLENLQ